MSVVRETLTGMNQLDRRILEFETNHPESGVLKEKAVLTELRMKHVTYQQRLLSIIKTPEAVEAFPMVVHRLERLAARRALTRTARRFD